MEQLHQHCKNCETGQYDQRSIVFYPRFQFRGHERKIFSPLDQKEVDNSCRADATEYSYLPFQVAVTDIILLDVFNSLGMPTSTTVSMVFELLGATFVVALIKMAGGIGLGFDDLLNTEKALSVILGIFLSVAIAFFFHR